MISQGKDSESPLIIGIDIGGTKTHLRAEYADAPNAGNAGERILPSSQWRTRSWNGDALCLFELVSELAAGRPISAIGIGAHGCDDDEECRAFETAFSALTDIPVSVVNDAELMPLALGLAGQIGVVAGTGSIAVCRPLGKRMMSAGGWGWLVGDEGSAAGLVRDAVRAVARHLDAGGEADEPLAVALMESLSVPSLPRLGSVVATLGGPAAVGAHAEAVFDAAARGSSLARNVIEEGGRELARLVMHLDARGAQAAYAVAGGSVIVAQPSLWKAFSEALTEASCARITPQLFRGSPVEGACRLAAMLSNSLPGRRNSYPATART
ncbi:MULTISPECIES: N-acetylglucosamine kinase [Chelativorans]|jgi:N-acetylglucosamine kinase-like BadF-type ATPase|uniref:ATPase, BadF/BadG/BcrA/BcrD type n=1 Tax=Chelativorans sp. (strain BNC1) TaxID=266779 RepID=Q11CF0_CHESB|nr:MULTISPECIES: sugar kinase [Chelativorans]